MEHEAAALEEIALTAAPLAGQHVLELTQATTTAFITSAPCFSACAVTTLALPSHFDEAQITSLLAGRQFDLLMFSRVLTFATETQAKMLAKMTLRALRADGTVTFRESCLQEPFPAGSGAVYRHPSFYIGMFGTTVTDAERTGFSYLEFMHCKSVTVYRQQNHTHGELCFTYKKVEQPAEEEDLNRRGRSASQEMDTFQNFLDHQQYSNTSITRYEQIFGDGYVSTGGQETTTEFVAMLGLQAGERVLDVGCGIGGGAFYMANTFGVSVHGIDLSTNMVYRAMERFAQHHIPRDGNDVEFEICDATAREFERHSFDVVYSRDTILHIENKKELLASMLQWLKPGGRLLISDYCCRDDQPPSERFQAYVAQRGYVLLSAPQYGRLLEDVGFTQVRVQDRTDQFVDVLQRELTRTYENKALFIEETSDADFNDIVQGWEAKLARCADGDQKWGLFTAIKP